MKEFFDEQGALTSAKIKVYNKYLTAYLPKVLQGF